MATFSNLNVPLKYSSDNSFENSPEYSPEYSSSVVFVVVDVVVVVVVLVVVVGVVVVAELIGVVDANSFSTVVPSPLPDSKQIYYMDYKNWPPYIFPKNSLHVYYIGYI